VNGAGTVARALHDAGVDTVFGLPGAHNLSLWPACSDAGVRVVGMRHEQGCAYAADGFARATGRVGVALVTTGPGAANTVAAVGEAWAARSPVVVIATDIPSELRRAGTYRGVLHECTDQAALFAPITKARTTAGSADDIEAMVHEAVSAAAAAPTRPVYLGIPTDFLAADAAPSTPAMPQWRTRHADIGWLLEAIAASERPLLWIGGGARDASTEIDALARKLGAPVVTTYQARGVLAPDHPLLVGAPPHEPEVTALIEQADLLIAVGSDFDQMNTMAWRLPLPARRVAINLDAADATKNVTFDGVDESDARFAGAIADAVPEREPWIDDVAGVGSAIRARLAADDDTRNAVEFLEHTEAALGAGTVAFVDMCIAGYWLAGHLRVGMPRSLHYPMGWGTLGFALPAAIGFAATRPDAPTVAFVGDGGALFGLGELSALAEHRSPCTLVIVDDDGYGMLRYGHEGEDIGSDLPEVDFVAVAAGFGIEAERVEGVGPDYAKALAAATAAGVPRVVHVVASLTPPVTTTPRWPMGNSR
jgi:acetolactate synthase-1/2/3 large subunit